MGALKHIGAISRSAFFAIAMFVGLFAAAACHGQAAEKSPLDHLDALLAADWKVDNWVGNLLDHVDANLDASLPLVDGGWTAALRHLVYDCWTREEAVTSEEELRSYEGCGPSAGRVHLRMHDVVWVLIRHEWAIYTASVGNQDGKVAAWKLEQAIAEYKNLVAGAEPRSVEPFATTLKRLRIIKGYVEELAPLDDGEYLTDAQRRQLVRDEINRQLALDGSGTALGLKYVPYLSIVGPLQELTRDTMQAYLSGAEAEQDAKSLAALVYGNGRGIANAQGDDLEGYLAEGEAEALSLSSLKTSPELGQLYAFVIEAIAARPNAIGISERYAELKKRLLLRVTAADAGGIKEQVDEAKKTARGLSATQIKLYWPDDLRPEESDGNSLTLDRLWSGDDVVMFPDEAGAASYGSLDQACLARSESDGAPSGRCPYKALADRVLRASDSVGADPFQINAREQSLLLLLDEVSNSDKAKALPGVVELVRHLMEQTRQDYSSPEEGDNVEPATSITDHVFALPYRARPNFLQKAPENMSAAVHAQSKFDRRLCEMLMAAEAEIDGDGSVADAGVGKKPAPEFSPFFASRCMVDPDAFEDDARLPNLLYARFDRLLIGEPTSTFEAKIGGLNHKLSAIDERLVVGNPEDGFSLIKSAEDGAVLAKEDTFIRRICDQSLALLPALAAAGLREVSLPPVGLDDEVGLELCR